MNRIFAATALIAFAVTANAGEIRTTATADRDSVRLSDSVTVTLTVEADAPLRVEPDRAILNEATAEVWRARPIGTPKVDDLPNGRQRWVQAYRLDPYVPGELALAFGTLKVFAGVAPEPVLVDGPSVTVRVNTTLIGSGPGEARPFTGIEEVPPAPVQPADWGQSIYLIGGLLLLVGGVLGIVRRLRRKPTPPSPRQRAIAELARLDDPDILEAEFAERLAEAVRGLVGSATLTSLELLATVPVELRDDLGTVLSRCDLAKFAGVPIAGAERVPLLASARHIRSTTEPVESPR